MRTMAHPEFKLSLMVPFSMLINIISPTHHYSICTLCAVPNFSWLIIILSVRCQYSWIIFVCIAFIKTFHLWSCAGDTLYFLSMADTKIEYQQLTFWMHENYFKSSTVMSWKSGFHDDLFIVNIFSYILLIVNVY